MRTIFLAFSLFIFNYGYCGGGGIRVPDRFFQMTNTNVNYTEGDLLYKSQAGGYYSGGGGVTVRSPVKSTQLANIQIPQIQAGCGGIDIYTGGLSFVSGQQIVDTLKSISSNAAGFAFLLGLESVSPILSNNMRQLQSWANMMNGIGINSCETAAQLVGSVWPAHDMASQHICRSIGTKVYFPNYLEGRHQCGVNRDMGNSTKELIPYGNEYNIAWEALIIQPYFKDKKNLEMAEMYMTLVGTFVIFNEQFKPYQSKAEDNEFLDHLLKGGMIKKYKCSDTDKCLKIEEIDVMISDEESWLSRIRKAIFSMHEKARSDTPLNENEIGLLSTTRLPLYKIINVLSAYYRGGSCAMDLESLADVVTWDVLSQILHEAIYTVQRGCMQLKAQSMYSLQIDDYLKKLEQVQAIFRRFEDKAQKAIDLEMRLIQKMQLLEKQLNSEIMVN